MWRWCRRSPASHAALSWRGKYLAEAPLDSGALESKHCLLLPQVGVGFQRKGSALSVFSWSRGDAGGAGAALGKWLERAGAIARALLVLSNLCFLCSPWRVLEDLSEVWSPLWGPCLVLSAQHVPILFHADRALHHPISTWCGDCHHPHGHISQPGPEEPQWMRAAPLSWVAGGCRICTPCRSRSACPCSLLALSPPSLLLKIPGCCLLLG